MSRLFKAFQLLLQPARWRKVLRHSVYLWRLRLGCLLHEWWPTACVLWFPALAEKRQLSWFDLKNRDETLRAEQPGARVCDWEYSSLLTVARAFPRMGGRLLQHCQARGWPMALSNTPLWSQVDEEKPQLSIIIPISGNARAKQLDLVLQSLFAQQDGRFEIILVEHDVEPLFQHYADRLRYEFIDHEREKGFNKSLCMNHAATVAAAEYLLFHDGDVVVPTNYCAQLLSKFSMGFDAVRPVRFGFWPTESECALMMQTSDFTQLKRVSEIQQHNPGLSSAVARDVYFAVGGHDERYWGWGGEDVEFRSRLHVHRVFPGGYAPVLHLWHPPAPKKASGDRNNELMHEQLAISPDVRIDALRVMNNQRYGWPL